MLLSKLLKTIPLTLGLAGILGCTLDEPQEIRLKEYAFGEGKSRVEIIKNVVSVAEDFYTINVYGPDGGLVCSIEDRWLGSGDSFIIERDSVKYNVSGSAIRESIR